MVRVCVEDRGRYLHGRGDNNSRLGLGGGDGGEESLRRDTGRGDGAGDRLDGRLNGAVELGGDDRGWDLDEGDLVDLSHGGTTPEGGRGRDLNKLGGGAITWNGDANSAKGEAGAGEDSEDLGDLHGCGYMN